MVNGKILIADDFESHRDLLTQFIKMLFPEYESKTFEDGNKLEERIKRILVNGKTNERLILTDNTMPPGPSGLNLITKYSNKLITEYNIPIILQYGDIDEIGKKAVENGAFGYLKKPFSPKDFKDMVQSAFNKYKD